MLRFLAYRISLVELVALAFLYGTALGEWLIFFFP